MTHYRAFIEIAKGLGATQESLKHADSQLDALLADLPTLSAACEHFAQSTAVFTAKRAESKQLLSASAPSENCMREQTCCHMQVSCCAFNRHVLLVRSLEGYQAIAARSLALRCDELCRH